MAAKKAQQVEKQLPEGFAPVSLDGQQNWAVLEEGSIIQGELLARVERRTDPGKFIYQVRVTGDAVKAIRGAKEEREEIMVAAGETVAFDERARLADLANHIGDLVYIECLGKSKHPSKKGQTMWNFNVGYKRTAHSMPLNGAVSRKVEQEELFDN